MDLAIDTLRVVVRICLVLWVASTVFGTGLRLQAREALAPLRDGKLVAAALAANYVLAPLLALLVVRFLPLSDGFRIGLTLTAVGAGAPFLPMLVDRAKGDHAWAVALMVLLTSVTALYMPLVLPLLLPGVQVAPFAIARSLVLFMLLPLAAGLALRARNEALALRLVPVAARVANVTLVLTFAIVVGIGFPRLVGALGRFGILAAAILVLGGTAIGYLLGGPRREIRLVLGLGTGSRNAGAALAVASENFSEIPDVTLMCVIVVLVTVALLLPLAVWLGRSAVTPDLDPRP